MSRMSVAWSGLVVATALGCGFLWSTGTVGATSPPGGAFAWVLLAAAVALAVSAAKLAARQPPASGAARWAVALAQVVDAGLLAIVAIVRLVTVSAPGDVLALLFLAGAIVGLNASAARLATHQSS